MYQLEVKLHLPRAVLSAVHTLHCTCILRVLGQHVNDISHSLAGWAVIIIVIRSRTRSSGDHFLQLCYPKPHFLELKWSFCYCKKQAEENVKQIYRPDVIMINLDDTQFLGCTLCAKRGQISTSKDVCILCKDLARH